MTKIILILMLLLSQCDAALRPVFDGKGTYRAWQKNDGIELAIGESVDFKVVVDDGYRKGDSIDSERKFDLTTVPSLLPDDVNPLTDMCFKQPAKIGEKKFAQRMISVRATNFLLPLNSFKLKVNSEDEETFENNGEMVVEMEPKDFYKNVVGKMSKGITFVPSPIDTKSDWHKTFGTFVFGVAGENPLVELKNIEKFILTVNEQKNVLATFKSNGDTKWNPDLTGDGFFIQGKSITVNGFVVPMVWVTRPDGSKLELKSLSAEFVLKTSFLNANPKPLKPFLKRNLLLKVAKEKNPKQLYLIIFCFVSGLIMAYFSFLFYIGDIGSRPMIYRCIEEYEFSTMRRFFCPLYVSELTKVLPLCFLMVCTVFVYSTYRDIKDAMVVGAAKALGIKAGNVMTNWLKVVGVLPGSLLFTSGLLALTSRLRFPTVFYIVTSFFGFYFAVNAWILYPNRQDLMFHSLIERMKKIDGEDNFWLQLELGILGIFAFPVTSMHYIMSELWGTVTLSFLAWGYINLITQKKDARRWYPMVALLAQIGQTVAGKSVSDLASAAKKTGNVPKVLKELNVLTLVLTVFFGITLFWLDVFVLQIERFKVAKNGIKNKETVGLCAGLKYAITDAHVFCLTGIVFSYGAVMVAIELTYKDAYSSQFMWDTSAMSSWKGKETFWTGNLTFACMLFVGSNMLNHFGWLFTALFTPVLSLILSVVFYICAIGTPLATNGLIFLPDDGKLADTVTGTNTNGSWFVCYVGLVTLVFIKSFKYATLDPTKEIAYLPLTNSEKSRAKAVVDIVGARAGKSVGALFNIFFTAQFSGIGIMQGMKWCSFLFSLLLLIIWIASAYFLNNHIKHREEKNKLDALKENSK